MKNLIALLSLIIISSNAWSNENDLTTTYIDKLVNPSKSTVERTIKLLNEALTANSSAYAQKLAQARRTLDKKLLAERFNAAIVITEEMYQGQQQVNLADYDDFLETAKDICYNGDINQALKVAQLLKEDIWIYDEYELDSIIVKNNQIVFKVMDLFTYSDIGAEPDQREDFMTYYRALKCK